MTRKITIIGLGLIGCSIGLALQEYAHNNSEGAALNLQVVGYDADLGAQGEALKLKAISKAEFNLGLAVENAALIILAVPPKIMAKVFADLKPFLKSGMVITDTASTKKEIMQQAAEILPEQISFVGGHPMAGGEGGAKTARPDLFQQATWCIEPLPTATQEALELINWLVEKVCGAQSFFVSAAEHDSFVAAVSHLPFIMSTSLIETTTSSPSWDEMSRLAATGFQDLTRLASGSPIMHRDIALTNREPLIHWINRYISSLISLRDAIEESDDEGAELLSRFTDAKDQREEWQSQRGELRQAPLFTTFNDSAKKELQNRGSLGRMLMGNFGTRHKDQNDK